MRYRTFGKLDWKPSALGFGAMRLPVIGTDTAAVDEPEATRMIRWAIDHGVNYVDTAYTYHGGNSEPFLGRALQDGYRQRVKLATKLPSWLVKTADDFDRHLNEQLQRLQTDHIDFYLLHSLDENTWHNLRDLHVFDWAEGAMAGGRFQHLGFSFHDRYEVFQEIVDAYANWTFCQIQYNFMDEEHQAGTRGLRYAANKGLAVVVMEPLRGGGLATPPPEVQAIWDGAPHWRSAADWGLRWVWNHPEVSLALSGMSSMQQVDQNVASAEESGIGLLSADELALIARVRDAYRGLCPVPCTDCQYCQPCASGVNIPAVFKTYNEGLIYGQQGKAKWLYGLLDETQRANHCTECGECEELCPQGIAIREWLKKAHEFMQ